MTGSQGASPFSSRSVLPKPFSERRYQTHRQNKGICFPACFPTKQLLVSPAAELNKSVGSSHAMPDSWEQENFWVSFNNLIPVTYFKDRLWKSYTIIWGQQFPNRSYCMSCGTFGGIWRQCWLSLLGHQFEYRTGRQPKKSTVPRDLFERTMRQLKTAALYKMFQCCVLFFFNTLL